MSQLSKLMQVTEDQKKKILEQHNMTQEDFQESTEVLKKWLTQNENFPEDAASNENMIKVALLNGKMSMEKAKRTIEGFFTVHAVYEGFFERLIPDEKFRKIANLSQNVIMPKLLPDLCRLQISKITDNLGEAVDGLDYYIMPLMIGQLRMSNDFFLSNELLIDMQYFSLRVLTKFTPSVNHQLLHVLDAINLRIHKIHIINAGNIWDKVYLLLKVLLPAKFLDKVLNHRTFEDLHEHIPKEFLPSDYGGTEKSLKEIHEMWSKELEENESVLKNFRKLRVKIVTRREQEIVDNMGMGMDGSFKLLTID